MEENDFYRHSRTRTTSSNLSPAQIHIPTAMHLEQPKWHGHSRHSHSVNTVSTISSGGSNGISPDYIRRSTSSRSHDPPATSYVALLRKQKATVWCDRAQCVDPIARRNKILAKELVQGGGPASGASNTGGGRTSTGLSSNKISTKIRHHGKVQNLDYTMENHIGIGGVPMRLSATEVEGEDSDGDEPGNKMHHRRTGSSGRSSIGSGRRGLYRTSGGGGMGSQSSRRDTPERAGSLVEERAEEDLAGGSPPVDDGSDAEKADNVGELGVPNKATNSMMHSKVSREKGGNTVEDLKRRGSVDERSMTLTKGRLFIANPD